MQLRTTKSYIKRQRKLNPAKQEIFDIMWPKYGLDLIPHQIDFEKIFTSSNITNLEIGCGNGEVLFHLAQNYPEQNFIGMEIHKPGIAFLLTQLKNTPLSNVRIYNDDAVAILKNAIPDKSLDRIFILYPDPWPKKRHNKRRLIQYEFVELLQKKLKPGGIINIETDWEDYALHIADIFKENCNFFNLDVSEYTNSMKNRPITKFQQKGQTKGHSIFSFWYGLI